MAANLIVEDGSGMETATSYVDLDYLHTYWEQNGFSYSAPMTITQEIQLLNRSAVFLDGYKLNWGGVPVNSTQALQFPRTSLYDRYGYYVSGVPKEIKAAQAVMAYYISSKGLESIAPISQVDGEVKSYSEQVGAIKESKEYFAGTSSAGAVVRIPEIDALLKRFNTGRYGAVNVSRIGGSNSGTYRSYYGL